MSDEPETVEQLLAPLDEDARQKILNHMAYIAAREHARGHKEARTAMLLALTELEP